MNTLKEWQQFIVQELEEYEETTPMTDEERKALHWWVDEGNSVHENWSLACWEGGAPMDFLDVYREEMNERKKLEAMSKRERSEYLYKEYGYAGDIGVAQGMEKFMEEDASWEGL